MAIGGDMGTAVRTDGSQGRHVRLAEEGLNVCGDQGGHIEFIGDGAPAFYREAKWGVKPVGRKHGMARGGSARGR